jgi:aspartyl protease family protein
MRCKLQFSGWECVVRLLALLFCLALSFSAAAETQINVVGLFSGKAILAINGGKPKTYAAGQTTPEGVRILSADSSKVVLDVDGKRRELGMGQGISISGGAGSGAQTATLYGNNDGHFLGEGYINGSPFKFLVDTGATAVAMSSVEARRLGLNYVNGQVGAASTAAGVVKAYRVSLNTVKIGNIVLHQVDAMVVEGNSPPIVLLGMTVLNRVQMERDGLVMTLTKKY